MTEAAAGVTARVVGGGRAGLAEALARAGAPAASAEATLAREGRIAVALEPVPAEAMPSLTAAARAQGLALFHEGLRALLLGPAILVREVARDLPPELGAPLGAAADRARAGERPRALRHARGALDLARPVVMGVVNVTPDSFSDGGLAATPEAAIARGRRLAEEGAAIVDVGGESTRPGATPVALEEEARRVLPVVEALAALAVPVSIDTRKPQVAALALAAGAAIVNDVGGLSDPRMVEEVARAHAGAVVMHMRGDPATMQDAPRYEDVVSEVAAFLDARAHAAIAAGVAPGAVAVDPGFGFGKTLAHNLALLRRLDEIASLGFPVLVGLSRKSALGALTGRPPGERMPASVAAAALAVARGASIVRAHDVRETVDAIAVAAAVGEGAA
jgi:dihydropteroate synthase